MKKITAFLLITVMLFTLTSCADKGPDLIKPAEAKEAFIKADKGEVSEAVIYDACISAPKTEAFFPYDAVVAEVKYRLGEEVKAGDPVIVLKAGDDEYISALEDETEAFSQISEYYVKQHENEIESMNNTLAGLSGFEKEKYELDIREKKTENKLFDDNRTAELINKEAELEEIRYRQGLSVITAPCDGRLCFLAAYNEGDSVKANTCAFVIIDESDPYIEYEYQSVDDFESFKSVKAVCGSHIYDSLVYRTYSEDELVMAKNYGHTLYTRLDAELSDDVNIGDYVCIYQYSEKADDVLRVPNECLTLDAESGETYLFVKSSEGKKKVFVETGIKGYSYTEITSGINEGDEIYWGEDMSIFGLPYTEVTPEKGDFAYELNLEMVKRFNTSSELITAGVKGSIDQVYVAEGDTVSYIEAGDSLISIKPSVTDSDVEAAKAQYEKLEEENEKELAELQALIDAKQQEIDAESDDIEKTLKEYELADLNKQYEQKKEELDEKLSDAKEKYEKYEELTNGEPVVISFDKSVFFSPLISLSSNYMVDEGTQLGYTESPDVCYLFAGDANLSGNLDENAIIRYGSEVIVEARPTEDAEATEIKMNAVFTKDVNDEAYDGHILAAPKDSSEMKNVIGIISAKYRLYDISDVITVPSSCIIAEGTEGNHYVMIIEGDCMIKRYVDAVIDEESGKAWIRSGLNENDKIADYGDIS